MNRHSSVTLDRIARRNDCCWQVKERKSDVSLNHVFKINSCALKKMKREVGEASAPCCPKSVVVRASLVRTGTESSSSLNKAAACVGKKKKKHLNKIMWSLKNVQNGNLTNTESLFCKKIVLELVRFETYPSPW